MGPLLEVSAKGLIAGKLGRETELKSSSSKETQRDRRFQEDADAGLTLC